mgnify:CR=1 FL=1
MITAAAVETFIESMRPAIGMIIGFCCFVTHVSESPVDSVPITIAHSLGLGLSGSAEAQLIAYLRDKSMLLVLDNFEHLLAEGNLLVELLQEAPGVKLLITSREARPTRDSTWWSRWAGTAR